MVLSDVGHYARDIRTIEASPAATQTPPHPPQSARRSLVMHGPSP